MTGGRGINLEVRSPMHSDSQLTRVASQEGNLAARASKRLRRDFLSRVS